MAALNAASGMNYGQQSPNKRLMIACDAIFAAQPAGVSCRTRSLRSAAGGVMLEGEAAVVTGQPEVARIAPVL
ncbi:hypothetical protein ASE23_16105 [Rhizobium sp. Root73]|nr:hypothetical protein ASC96_03125 [Rhizobium sp. Root1204]KQY18226.1 hypothetical protein ASD36_06545 [Rhizobium sp. Root1334]KRB98527.1 hypothetical protein ASE23_16105 [Rhizobium sp. Root73]